MTTRQPDHPALALLATPLAADVGVLLRGVSASGRAPGAGDAALLATSVGPDGTPDPLAVAHLWRACLEGQLVQLTGRVPRLTPAGARLAALTPARSAATAEAVAEVVCTWVLLALTDSALAAPARALGTVEDRPGRTVARVLELAVEGRPLTTAWLARERSRQEDPFAGRPGAGEALVRLVGRSVRAGLAHDASGQLTVPEALAPVVVAGLARASRRRLPDGAAWDHGGDEPAGVDQASATRVRAAVRRAAG